MWKDFREEITHENLRPMKKYVSIVGSHLFSDHLLTSAQTNTGLEGGMGRGKTAPSDGYTGRKRRGKGLL